MFLTSGEDNDLLPYIFASYAFILLYVEHPPVAFACISLSRSAVSVRLSHLYSNVDKLSDLWSLIFVEFHHSFQPEITSDVM